MRPYVHVNVAMSADGKLSTRERRQVKISGSSDFARVDRLRAESDAVMVGIGTVLADDPSLTVKSQALRDERVMRGADENPVRVVVDSSARTPPSASVLHKGPGRRVIAVSNRADPGKLRELEPFAVIVKGGEDRVDLAAFLRSLHGMGVNRLMVEGGGTLIWGLLAAGLVDEITSFVGNMVIGGENAPTLAEGEGFVREDSFVGLMLEDATRIDEGILLRWKVRR
ncbi:MAG: 2,5-diamino-6-(ribosylamino)-4(3H)-pyrimidinone 5'-phosphate reductase [Methanoregulaceae archaeon]|nr:2,5-diamino-6-(ribosylamino)-4(3H)-pyrimidinone 5'-phosphate reductase [Methanoregulaceae archaeon]